MIDPALKKCSGCGLDKPATLEFYSADKRKKSGIQGPCRACMKINIQKRFDAIKHTLSVQSVRDEQEVFRLGQAKTCNHCKKSKPIESYYLSKGAKDGHRPTCIECWRVIHHRTSEQNKEYREKYGKRIRAYDRERIKPGYKKKEKALYDKRYRDSDIKKQKNWAMKRNFGITLDQYEQMFKNQNGLCGICFQPEVRKSIRSDKPKNLAVDHCHESGTVRGLLCQDCNTGVGLFKDSPLLMIKAAKYLKKLESQGVSDGVCSG